MVDSSIWGSKVTTEFLLDNLRFDFSSLNPQTFSYARNPVLRPLNQQDPLKAYRYNPGSFIQLEVRGEAVIVREEVVVLLSKAMVVLANVTILHCYMYLFKYKGPVTLKPTTRLTC